jgi:hypothetical protein
VRIKTRNAYKIFVENLKGQIPLGSHRHRPEDSIKMIHQINRLSGRRMDSSGSG